MTGDELQEWMDDTGSRYAKFAVTDIDGVLRGKLISGDKLKKMLADSAGFCDVVFGWDASDALYDNSEATGWHTGYPDATARLDTSTLRSIPWDQHKPFYLGDFSEDPVFSKICPRALLHKVLEKAEQSGYQVKAGFEYEWFNFRETPESLSEKKYRDPDPISPGMFGYSVLRSSQFGGYIDALLGDLEAFEIPVEALHTETGDGVYEAAINYTHAKKAADLAVLFKNSVKEIASAFGIMASFMAKWNIDLPGCSGHIHQSLWNEDGSENQFDGEPKELSEPMQQYLAGILHCMPVLMPLYCPTVNSYKRLVEGSWAPTTVSWGFENRTAALRVINKGRGTGRIENRVPGSDANPYLALAATVASGLYGMEQELSLEQEAVSGNAYEAGQAKPLPRSLEEAVNRMKESELPAQLLGAEFCDHFIRSREWECRQYRNQVSSWELKRYFEII